MSNDEVRLQQQHDYQFLIHFGESLPPLLSDEPPPIGQGQGPTPLQLLAAAVANCLTASLHFAFDKFKQHPGAIRAQAKVTVARNAQRRARIKNIEVQIYLTANAADMQLLQKILDQFEDFCTVTQSVREGIDIDVKVFDGAGVQLK